MGAEGVGFATADVSAKPVAGNVRLEIIYVVL